MTKSKFFTGSVTLILLLSIIFVLKGFWNDMTVTTIAQNQAPQEKNTATLERLTLSEMVSRADRIFRGTVVDFEPGTINVGGTNLPTVTYKLRVEQSFKGNFESKGDVQYAEITILGSIKKAAATGSLRKFSVLPTPPQFTVGSDYLLLMTPESSIGLSIPVGLGQGSFEIFTSDKQEWAKNEFNNAGLFNGPVRYGELAAKIQKGGQ